MGKVKITVKVRFMGILELYAGARFIYIDMTEGKTLDFVLDYLLKITPPAYKNLITQKQKGEPFLRILVNEALVHEKDFSRSLSHNDLITILPGISGG